MLRHYSDLKSETSSRFVTNRNTGATVDVYVFMSTVIVAFYGSIFFIYLHDLVSEISLLDLNISKTYASISSTLHGSILLLFI